MPQLLNPIRYLTDFVFVFAGLMVFTLLAGQPGSAQPLGAAMADFHVSPQGDDANPGTQARPFASVARAQEAVRATRQANPESGVEVVLAAGVYPLDQPLQFTPVDSGFSADKPVIYRAAPGAEVVISGGRAITGWQPDPQWPGVWKTHLPGSAADATDAWRFEQLWVNGRWAVRARNPNWMDFAVLRLILAEPVKLGVWPMTYTLTCDPAHVTPLRELSERELHDVQMEIYHKWSTSRIDVASVSAADATLTTGGPKLPPWNKVEPGNLYVLDNWLGALDAPGEWFLDRQGWLYYQPRPDEDMAQAQVFAPVFNRLLTVEGEPSDPVEHLRFEGIGFSHASIKFPPGGIHRYIEIKDSAIMLDHVRDVQFVGGIVKHVGGMGIWFRHDCGDSGVRRMRLVELGSGAIRVGEPDIAPEPQRTGRITIDNCIIQAAGMVRPDAIAVCIGQSADNIVSHCDISDLFYSAITVGWTLGYGEHAARRNRIEYNHIHHLGYRVLSDMGGIYTMGKSEGTVIRNNVIHDVYAAIYGGWGLYGDEGTSDILYENNLVYNVKDGGFHQHYGRENIIRNNIFAFSQEGQVAVTRAEPHLSFTFENNIVYWDEGELLGSAGWNNGVKVDLRSNLYWRADGQPFDFNGQTWAQWRAAGHDEGSIIADPLFVDASQRDFQLRPGSPAQKIGFKPFDPSEAGVYGDDAWKRLAGDRTYPKPFAAPPPRPLLFRDEFTTGAASLLLNVSTLVQNNRLDLIAISDDPAGGANRCLRVQDAQGLPAVYMPYFCWEPNATSGQATLTYRIRLEPGASAQCQWRDRRSNYSVGPSVEFKDGAVWVNQRRLMDIPANTWFNVAMRVDLGRPNTKWSLSVTLPDAQAKVFDDLPCDPKWTKAWWVGFMSQATTKVAFYLDNVEMECQ